MTNDDATVIRTTDREGSPSIAVVGGADEGRTVAEELAAGHDAVAFYHDRPSVLRRTADAVRTAQVDFEDPQSLTCIDVGPETVVVLAGVSDRRNLLVGQLLRTGLDVERVIVRVNDPATADSFESIGYTPVLPEGDLPEAVAAAVETIDAVEGEH